MGYKMSEKVAWFCLLLMFFFMCNASQLPASITIPDFVYHSPLNSQMPQKKFVIVITSFNNAEWCIYNLASVFEQQYENYRVIYVDDCSDDGTADLVEAFIQRCGQAHRCTLIKNSVRKRALANFYYALNLCDDDEIVFNYDGDDWFAHDMVFAKINELYQDPNVWITYGQYINWPTGELGYCKELPDGYVKNQLFRRKWWKPGQLRTFYAWLCKQVQLKDLLFEGGDFNGQFFPANADLALYYPMMEMAGPHYKFIDEVIYIRNVQTPLNDFKANRDIQIEGSRQLRAKQKYPALKESRSTYFEAYAQCSADIIYVACCAASAREFIEYCRNRVTNYTRIVIVTEEEQQAEGYDELAQIEGVKVVCCADQLKNGLKAFIAQSYSSYILIASDRLKEEGIISLSGCIESLERAFADFFFFADVQGMAPLNEISSTMGAVQFGASKDMSTLFTRCKGLLLRKESIYRCINDFSLNSLEDFYAQWYALIVSRKPIGLCYQ